MAINFKTEADALSEELVERRRDLHQHPETAFEEVRTAGIVAEELTRLGMEVQTGVGKTGVVGILEGDTDGPTVLVRADMDALPIEEENAVAYRSQVAGKMHACGHDAHTSIGLGVAKLLSKRQGELRGRVKFVFQPAEEIAGGALAMIEDGVLDTPRPDVSLGLHVWNSLPLGQVGLASGPIMAGSNSFEITISGSGGHGASPHETRDPIMCAAQMISALQTIVSRNTDPLEGAVVSVTQVHAGSADNVIPQTATLRGTTRAFRPEVQTLIKERMQVIVESTAAAMGCTATLAYRDQTVPVINDDEVTQRVRGALRPLLSEAQILTDERTMGAEDMGYLMDDIPGLFMFVGSANHERDLDYGHHHPRFDIDEDVLPFGVALLSQAVAAYVLDDET